MAAGLGLEPRQADSESAVLPLHHPAIEAIIHLHLMPKQVFYYMRRLISVKSFGCN